MFVDDEPAVRRIAQTDARARRPRAGARGERGGGARAPRGRSAHRSARHRPLDAGDERARAGRTRPRAATPAWLCSTSRASPTGTSDRGPRRTSSRSRSPRKRWQIASRRRFRADLRHEWVMRVGGQDGHHGPVVDGSRSDPNLPRRRRPSLRSAHGHRADARVGLDDRRELRRRATTRSPSSASSSPRSRCSTSSFPG